MPIRIQRKRTKGWRMPDGAVYVGRPSPWGNRFVVAPHRDPDGHYADFRKNVDLWDKWPCRDAEIAVAAFREMQIPIIEVQCLRGKDLACWCPLCEKHKDGKPLNEACNDCAPCHVDVLGEVANS